MHPLIMTTRLMKSKRTTRSIICRILVKLPKKINQNRILKQQKDNTSLRSGTTRNLITSILKSNSIWWPGRPLQSYLVNSHYLSRKTEMKFKVLSMNKLKRVASPNKIKLNKILNLQWKGNGVKIETWKKKSSLLFKSMPEKSKGSGLKALITSR